ncbi:MAG: DNA polymerase [Ignavibacteria bacterium]|nr:DNA polymerase [Ignavibacteria bacterium]
MNPLPFGHNTDEGIVAVQQKDDSTMRVYFRESSGVRYQDEQFYPFVFLADKEYIDGFAPKHWVKKLEGEAFYQYVCAFEGWSTMWEAIRFVLDRHNRTALTKVENYNDLDIVHTYSDPVSQYLLQTGRTLFKGMTLDDVHRLQLDIETYASSGYRFSNANRPGDRIILIALSDNRGWQHLIDGKKLTEKEMLENLVRIISDKDPDVIEGHNIYSFDLPYILKRCELNSVAFTVGRDGSVPKSLDARTPSSERPFEYGATDIAGRHIIDTLLLVQNYDMAKRDMESYGLKYAAQYFGFAAPDRTYIEGNRISWHWDHDVHPLMVYALDDVTETRRLSELLSGTSFYLTQMLPFNYSQVVRMGSASKIESLMVREYLRQKHSIPKPAEGIQRSGGYTDILVVGILGPVLHVDVESLYPSIMINRGICPSSDVIGIFSLLLTDLTSLRIQIKHTLQKKEEPQERSRLDAMQSSLKILINSFYGYLAYHRALFNDYSKADEVTETGQMLLRQMIAHIQSEGGRVIEVDTDGVFFVPPGKVNDEKAEQQFVSRLSSVMPEGITITLDGRCRKMLSYKKKNYALLGYDGAIRIKGSSLTSRSMERFGRTYIAQCIECLLNNDIAGLHNVYTHVRQRIQDRKLDAKEFARVETLKDSLATYTSDVKAGKRNRSAAYEVALTAGKRPRQGDRIAYYVTGNDPNPRTSDNCKPIEDWDPNFPDENIQFYLRRLDEFSGKFIPFFLPQEFRAIFSVDDLFPFTPEGITILTVDMPEHEILEEKEAYPQEFGIWLDE